MPLLLNHSRQSGIGNPTGNTENTPAAVEVTGEPFNATQTGFEGHHADKHSIEERRQCPTPSSEFPWIGNRTELWPVGAFPEKANETLDLKANHRSSPI